MMMRTLWEVTVDSSLLIVVITLMRKLLKKHLNPNTIYFLWIFVLLCIVFPVRIDIPIEIPVKMPVAPQPEAQNIMGNLPLPEMTWLSEGAVQQAPVGEAATVYNAPPGDGNAKENVAVQAAGKPFTLDLHLVWRLTVAVLAFYVAAVNVKLHFYVRRQRNEIGECNGVKVYSLPRFNCLMGIFSPAIYIDTQNLGKEELIKNVVRHEYEHYRVKDNIWQMFRIICLVLQWHNPLAWWAYYASKQDGELACDARAIRDMSKEERYRYGESLLAVLGNKKTGSMIMTTSMGGTMKKVKERIELIMRFKLRNSKVLASVAVCLAGLVSAVAIGVVVRGESPEGGEDSRHVGVPGETDGGMQENPQGELPPEEMSPQETMLPVETMPSVESMSPLEALQLDLDITDYYSYNIGDPSNLYTIDEENALWGCGRNNCGQLGQGTQDYDFHEDMAKIAENVIHVDYSPRGFTIFLTEDHKLYGMGTAGSGALREYDEISLNLLMNPAHYTVNTPKLLMENVVYAKCGIYDVVCLLEDGSVWTWGTVWWASQQYYSITEPQKILEDVVLVTGGDNHAALQRDGSVWTWGHNFAGSCGVDGKIVISEPVKVAENAVMVWTDTMKYNVDCKDISEFNGEYELGLENTIILKEDGTYWACGRWVGEEEKRLALYWEVADFSMVCTSEFMEIEDLNEFCSRNYFLR